MAENVDRSVFGLKASRIITAPIGLRESLEGQAMPGLAAIMGPMDSIGRDNDFDDPASVRIAQAIVPSFSGKRISGRGADILAGLKGYPPCCMTFRPATMTDAHALIAADFSFNPSSHPYPSFHGPLSQSPGIAKQC